MNFDFFYSNSNLFLHISSLLHLTYQKQNFLYDIVSNFIWIVNEINWSEIEAAVSFLKYILKE